jgi:hypothetical protein
MLLDEKGLADLLLGVQLEALHAAADDIRRLRHKALRWGRPRSHDRRPACECALPRRLSAGGVAHLVDAEEVVRIVRAQLGQLQDVGGRDGRHLHVLQRVRHQS